MRMNCSSCCWKLPRLLQRLRLVLLVVASSSWLSSQAWQPHPSNNNHVGFFRMRMRMRIRRQLAPLPLPALPQRVGTFICSSSNSSSEAFTGAYSTAVKGRRRCRCRIRCATTTADEPAVPSSSVRRRRRRLPLPTCHVDPTQENQQSTTRSSAGRRRQQPSFFSFSSSSSSSSVSLSSSSSSTALYAVRVDDADGTELEDTGGEYDEESGSKSTHTTALNDEGVVVDVAIVGAGLAGLCAGALLNAVYNHTVAVYESHYLPGGCAHAFERPSAMVPNHTTFTLDSGPTILLGCSNPPYNALRQVLNAVNETVEWISYDAWGMIEHPNHRHATQKELRWRVELGPSRFEDGPLQQFGGPQALQEFQQLRDATQNLLAGANIPVMAMRPGPQVLIPLLRYFPTLLQLLSQGELATGTFAPFLNGPKYVVTDPWLRHWLDALAFSLSGLPAARTSAAAMAFVLYDMHRPGASLDYPKGGMGSIVDALVRGVQSGSTGSKLHLRHHVEQINVTPDGSRVTGLTLRNGKSIRTRLGVICNAPVWSLRQLLLANERALERLGEVGGPSGLSAESSWDVGPEGASIRLDRPTPSTHKTATDASTFSGVLPLCDSAEQTGSFLHLHLALNATGLDLDSLEAHYTVMDRGLSGDGSVINGVRDGPCGELNMIAVSNPCVLDRTLAPEGYIVVHAYGAANEPYQRWQGLRRNSPEYKALKQQRAQVLWRAVESVIPDARSRTVLELIGSPLTHERFLRRPGGTYGSATEDYLKDGSTGIDNLVLANDGVFPGIGVPAVCIAGASAANSFVPVLDQWRCLDRLERDAKI